MAGGKQSPIGAKASSWAVGTCLAGLQAQRATRTFASFTGQGRCLWTKHSLKVDLGSPAHRAPVRQLVMQRQSPTNPWRQEGINRSHSG